MTRTKLFYEEISSFRENLRNIEKEYTKGLSNIEKYKGSAAYTEDMIDDVLRRFDRVFANCGLLDRK